MWQWRLKPQVPTRTAKSRILEVMTYQSDPGPRRSYSGPQTKSSAGPRRAFDPEEPIMSGYTYQPGRTSAPPPLNPEASSPLIEGRPPSDSIDRYKPKKHLGWLIAGVAVVIIAIVGAVVLNSIPPPAQPTPTTSSRPTAYPTPTRSGGVAFADSSTSGYWKITNTQWDSSSVRLTIEITVDSGTLYYDFYAYANNDLTTVAPTGNPTDLRAGFVGPGQTVTGTLTFELPRQPMTLILLSSNQTQLSALPVEG